MKLGPPERRPEVRALPVFTAVDDEHVAAVKEAAGHVPTAGAVLTEHVLVTLRQAASQHPLDESLPARPIEVLAAAGRQSEALETCQVVRARIADEIGLDTVPDCTRHNAPTSAAWTAYSA
ncbi:BTAD domain-containing putative transcriptional regulator [Streptomyces sp. NPDC046915]|uniref:BTAD domain-containing putative transcriptional regulator n=1 Tax=Streptomyces sp. NPDC046915 TaxID=3155257 RepID=UPI0033E27B80